MFKFKTKINKKTQEKVIENIQKKILLQSKSAVNEGVMAYNNSASSHFPPPNPYWSKKYGQPKTTILQDLYWRPIYAIADLFKDKKISSKWRGYFINRWKNDGFNFVVFGYKDNFKKKTINFARTKEQAKNLYGRIKNRGLYKFLWGAKLNLIGKIKSFYNKLLSKSPNLSSLVSLSDLQITNTAKTYSIEQKINLTDYFFSFKVKQAARKQYRKNFRKQLKKDMEQKNVKLK